MARLRRPQPLALLAAGSRQRPLAGWRSGKRAPVALLVVMAALLLGLAGCGGEEDPAPATTAPLPSQSPTPITRSGPATPGASGTAGTIVDRISTAWGSVRSFRSTFTAVAAPESTGGLSPAASPAGTVPDLEIVDEILLPDRKHRTLRERGEVTGEFIGIGGRVFLRGPMAQAFVRPDLDPATWVEVDPTAVDPASRISGLIAALAAPVEPPYASLPAESRSLPITPLGSIEVEGRTCMAYGVVDTTATGERIEVTIALEPGDLPCLVETRAGGTVNRTVFSAFNEPFTIEPPVVATPTG